MTTFLALPMGDICYPRYPEDPPYPLIQPEWLSDIDITEIRFWLPPGVPDIKFYLEIEQHIDIQNARYALGIRVFQQVSDIETMLDWVGIEGEIRKKTLGYWYQRITAMQTSIEMDRPLMPSLALPYYLRQDSEVEYDTEEDGDYNSDQDGEYEADDEYDGNHGMEDTHPIDSSIDTSIHNTNAFTNNKNAVHQVQISQYNNNIINSAAMAHNFWPLLNRILNQDLTFLRLQMEHYCPHIANEINWDFLLCEPCTDVSVMIFLYVTSVWQSRPSDKEDELVVPVIWSLAMQLRVMVPSEQVLRVVEHTTATAEIPGLLPIDQWR